MGHLTEHDGGFIAILPQGGLHEFTEFFAVDKNDGLRQRANVEDVLNEFDLFLRLTPELVVVNVIKLQLFVFQSNLERIRAENINCFGHFLRVGS